MKNTPFTSPPCYNYILPAFDNVSHTHEEYHFHNSNENRLFVEYKQAIAIGKLILSRFGNTPLLPASDSHIPTPLFWIDMAKLFELYVLSLLYKTFGKEHLLFQATANFGRPDFLTTRQGTKIVIDAKYKLIYHTKNYDIDDIRQLSGYSRDKEVLNKLHIPKTEWNHTLPECLIIYPAPDKPCYIDASDLLSAPITQFQNFFALGVGLPLMNE